MVGPDGQGEIRTLPSEGGPTESGCPALLVVAELGHPRPPGGRPSVTPLPPRLETVLMPRTLPPNVEDDKIPGIRAQEKRRGCAGHPRRESTPGAPHGSLRSRRSAFLRRPAVEGQEVHRTSRQAALSAIRRSKNRVPFESKSNSRRPLFGQHRLTSGRTVKGLRYYLIRDAEQAPAQRLVGCDYHPLEEASTCRDLKPAS